MGSFKYRDKEYDAEKLVLCGGQGAPAKIDVSTINIVGDLESEHILVVASEGRYDMLGGQLTRNRQTNEPSQFQKVRILSRPVLKKALIPDASAVPSEQETRLTSPQHRPAYGQPRSYDRPHDNHREERPRFNNDQYAGYRPRQSY